MHIQTAAVHTLLEIAQGVHGGGLDVHGSSSSGDVGDAATLGRRVRRDPVG